MGMRLPGGPEETAQGCQRCCLTFVLGALIMLVIFSGLSWSEYSQALAGRAAERHGRVRKVVAHPGAVTRLAFSPDGKYLASGGHDTSVVVRDTSSWQRKHRLALHRGSIRIAAVADWEGTAQHWCRSTVKIDHQKDGDALA